MPVATRWCCGDGVGSACVNPVDFDLLEFLKGLFFLGSFHEMFDLRVGDDSFGLRFFAFQTPEIGGRDLQGIENEAGFLDLDLVAQDEFGDLAKRELDGVDVFESREMNFGRGIILIHAAIVQGDGAALLMVVTKLVIFQRG